MCPHLLCRLASEYPRTSAFKTTDTLSKTGKAATLTLPDGTEYKLDLMSPSHGSELLIDLRGLHGSSGRRILMYDPGLTSVATCASAISYLNGDEGACLYRGYAIEELVEHADFLSVAYLLLYGELPKEKEQHDFNERILSESLIHQRLVALTHEFPQDAYPMSILASLMSAMASFYSDPIDPKHMTDYDIRDLACCRIIAKLPVIVAMAYKHLKGEPFVYPEAGRSYSSNFLNMMFATPLRPYEVDPFMVHVLDVLLIVHADHEQNASTLCVRTAGSSLANPYACIAAGLTSLWGKAHGGASQSVIDMLEEIGSPSNVESFVERIKLYETPFPGFSHRVYQTYDPRARILRSLCARLFRTHPDFLFDIALQLEKVALADTYFVSRCWYPNIDFYSGLVMRALGIPKDFFGAVFGMARSIGWLGHVKELCEELQVTIARPRQLYVGAPPRKLEQAEKQSDQETCSD